MEDIKKIKEVRDKTGMDLKYCKIALEYTNNDVDKAMDVLYYTATRFLSWSKFIEKFGKKEDFK